MDDEEHTKRALCVLDLAGGAPWDSLLAFRDGAECLTVLESCGIIGQLGDRAKRSFTDKWLRQKQKRVGLIKHVARGTS